MAKLAKAFGFRKNKVGEYLWIVQTFNRGESSNSKDIAKKGHNSS